jgi:hypothetical protein
MFAESGKACLAAFTVPAGTGPGTLKRHIARLSAEGMKRLMLE